MPIISVTNGAIIPNAWFTDVQTAVFGGTAGQIWVATGSSGIGVWTNPASITVGNATNAVNATNATNATTATTATTATNATNVTGTINSAVTATTQTAGDNSTKVATTAFVQASNGPAGNYRKLTASATGTNATVTASADEICLTDGTGYLTFKAVSLSINTASSGANGLDTGTIAVDTWYSLWVIGKADGTVAGLISTSATAPTMPTGYTFKARIGWIRTDGTANKFPFGFTQKNNKVQYLVGAGTNLTSPRVMASSTSIGVMTAVSTANFVPTTAGSIHVTLAAVNIVNGQGWICGPNSSYSITTAPISLASPFPTQGTNITGSTILILETANVYWTGSSTGTSTLLCNGWEDTL